MTYARTAKLAFSTLLLFAVVQISIMGQTRPMRIEVRTTDGLQAAIDQIACGGTIAIQNGLILQPRIKLRNQDRPGESPCVTPTIIRREGPLPGAYNVHANCTQIGPTMQAEMARRDKCWQEMRDRYGKDAPKIFVDTADAQQGQGWAIYSDCGANYWTFQGLEIGSRSTVFDPPVYALVFLGGSCHGDGFGYFQNRAEIGHHITFEQMWFHGLTTSIGPRPKDEPASSTRRAILANADHFEFKDSLCDDFAEIGQDSQCVMVYNSYGPFRFDNLFVDAAGENIMFGGADPSRELPGLVPCDIDISNSYFTKNWNRWQHGSRVGYTDSPFNYQTKNSFELKNACRVRAWSNVFEASWAQNQMGSIILHQSMNQDGTCLHCTVQDVDHFWNIVRWGAEAFTFAGKAGQSGGSTMAKNIKFRDFLAYGLKDFFGQDSTVNPGIVGTGGTGFKLTSGSAGGPTHEPFPGLHIERGTVINDTQIAVWNNCGDTYTDVKFNDVIARAAMPWYDVQMLFCGSAGGKTAFDLYFPGPGGYEIERNVIGTDANHAAPWPASNAFISKADFENLFVDFANMDYRLKPGSLYEGRGVDFSKLPGSGTPVPPPPPQPACIFTIGSPSSTVPAAGGLSSVSVAAAPAGCTGTFAVAGAAAWATVAQTAGAVTFTAQPNVLVQPRSSSYTIGGQTFTLTQAAAAAPTPPACTPKYNTLMIVKDITQSALNKLANDQLALGYEFVMIYNSKAVFLKRCPLTP